MHGQLDTMSEESAIEPRFQHRGRVLMSTPGIEKFTDNVATLLEREHGNNMIRLCADFEVFANGEVKAVIPDTVRNEQIFLLCPMQHPTPNDACMRLFVLLDALSRASVAEIIVVLPYMCYLRQDRKAKKREPITAKMLIRFIESFSKVKSIITSDMHSQQEQGFGELPIDNIPSLAVFGEKLKDHFNNDFSNVTFVGPDLSSGNRARKVASTIDPRIPIAIIDKRHIAGVNGKTEVISLYGEVNGRDCVLVDDMIDGGGTTLNAAETVLGRGAKSVMAIATHAILSGGAIDKFKAAGVLVFATQSIPRSREFREANASWLQYEDKEFFRLTADAIHEASMVGGSISKLSA